MSHLAPEDIDAVGQHVTDSVAGALSIAELARRLGVSVPTARRRLLAYAEVHGLTLRSELVREGARGPRTARWFVVRPPRPPSPPVTSEAASFRLPMAVTNTLSDDERAALQLLANSGAARTSALAAQLGRSPDRMEGLMRTLRRKLHRQGTPMIDNETLPDGEALFRFVGKEA